MYTQNTSAECCESGILVMLLYTNFLNFFRVSVKLLGMPFYNLLSIQWECADGTVQIKLDLMPSVCGWVRSRGRNFP